MLFKIHYTWSYLLFRYLQLWLRKINFCRQMGNFVNPCKKWVPTMVVDIKHSANSVFKV